jgi:hypothetical protein
MHRFLDANPKDKHGTHRYTLEEFGLDAAALRQRLGAYCERFSIPVRS